MFKDKGLISFLVILMTLIVGTNVMIAAGSLNLMSTMEEGYWYSRYNLGNLVMRSGMGDTFMPDMKMMMNAIKAVDADFDPMQKGVNYGDGDHVIMPVNPALLKSVYKSGDPHYITNFNAKDFKTQRWNPESFDKILTGLANGFTIVKEVEWAKQFHNDEHFGSANDDFGAYWRFAGMILNFEAKMQAEYFLQHQNDFDLSNGGNYMMIWALSDLSKLLRINRIPNSENNRYKDVQAANMFQKAADELFNKVKDERLNTFKEKSLAIQALIWYASSTDNEKNKANAAMKIDSLSNGLKVMIPSNAAERAYALAGLIEAKRVLKMNYDDEIKKIASDFFNDFDSSKGFFNSQKTYSVDDVAVIVGTLNELFLFESNTFGKQAGNTLVSFFENVVNKAGLQQSAPPLQIAKSPFEYKDVPEIFFRYPGMPMPPMAGGKYGIAPVFASSVTYKDGKWNVGRRFDTAGAMHASNEMIWLHNDEINGFPKVDLSKYVMKTSSSLHQGEAKGMSVMPLIVSAAVIGVVIGLIVILQ